MLISLSLQQYLAAGIRRRNQADNATHTTKFDIQLLTILYLIV
jgi:hypothetical protein